MCLSNSSRRGGGGSGSGTESNRGKQSLTGFTKSKSDSVNYLRLYEAMVRHQDLEFGATHNHIAMIFRRVQRLGSRGRGEGRRCAIPDMRDEEGESKLGGMLTYVQMRRCLLRLGYTWDHSLPPHSSSNGSTSSGGSIRYYDDDVSVITVSSVLSGTGASKSSSSTMGVARDIIATDPQLILLLTTLVEMEERHRAMVLARGEDEEGDENRDALLSRGLLLPEFVQAYKLIIGGMQSLQTFPGPEDQPEALQKACVGLGIPPDKITLQDVRSRSRERTLGLLRLFGPDLKLYRGANEAPMVQSAGEPTSRSKTKEGLMQFMGGKKQQSGASVFEKKGMTAKDGLLPRLTEDEIKRQVQSKDAMLAKILEEHEAEMKLMATNVEEMRLRKTETQILLKKRRRHTRVIAIAGAVLLAFGGGGYEYRRREQVRLEIAAGREAERRADAVAIAGLREALALATSKLDDAEATIRYEQARNADISTKHEEVTQLLKENDGKWLLARRDLELCRAAHRELGAEMTSSKSRNDEAQEEAGWCRDRLANAERAMDGMEQALKRSRKDGVGKAGFPSFAEISSQIDAGDDKDEDTVEGKEDGMCKNQKKGGKLRPVMMEMKYNRSFRNGVILRQVYSAVGGMVASMLLPGAAKVFGLLFFR